MNMNWNIDGRVGRKIALTGMIVASVMVMVLVALTQAQETTRASSSPGKPGTLTGTSVKTGVALSWNAPDGDVAGYRIMRRRPEEGERTLLVYVSDTRSTATGYTDTGVSEGVLYVYRVKAVNDDEVGEKSNYVNVRWTEPDDSSSNNSGSSSTSPPGKPGTLTGTSVKTGVALSWSAPDGDVTGYRIMRRRPEEGERTLLVYVSDTRSTATGYTDTGVSEEVLYVYRVKAVNDDEVGEKSNYVNVRWTEPDDSSSDKQAESDDAKSTPTPTATPEPTPEAPGSLAGEVGSTGVVLTWTAPDGDVTGYRIMRRNTATSGSALEALVEDTGDANTAYTDTDVEHDGEYEYGVKAINDAQVGGQSDTVTVRWSEPLPSAPKRLGTAPREEGMYLEWTAPDTGSVTGYQILRRRPNECQDEWTVLVENTGSQHTTYVDTDMIHNVVYAYRVKAVNRSGVGPQSNWGGGQYRPASKPVTDDVPGAPRNLSATMTRDGIELLWAAPKDDVVTGYRILKRSPDLCERQMRRLVEDTGSTDTAYMDADVVLGRLYIYQVMAVNGDAVGPGSFLEREHGREVRYGIMVAQDADSVRENARTSMTIAVNHMVRDSDPNTVDYTLRGDVTLNSDKSDADSCEGEGLGSDIQITVVDEVAEQFEATFGGFGCSAGQYTLTLVLDDKDGNQVLSLPLGYTVTQGGAPNRP